MKMDDYVRLEPYDHQRVAYGVAMRHPASAMLMEQGTGKTLVGIAVMGARFDNGEIRHALIVCPSSIMRVWEREIRRTAAFPCETVVLDKGTKRNKQRLQEFTKRKTNALSKPRLKVVIVNYESVWRIDEGWDLYKPDLIIADESQKIKNRKAKQSRFMHFLGRMARYKMILTGTPVTQGPLDFWSQYKFLDTSIFHRNYYAFRNKYAVMGGYENKQVVGYRHLDELTRRAHSIAYRVTKEQALDLPEKIFQDRYCRLPEKAMREYKRMVREDLALIENGKITAQNVLTRMLRLSQITGGHVTTEDGTHYKLHDAKVNELMDILEETKKCVVFVRFVHEIKGIIERLEDAEIDYEAIWGDVPYWRREEAIQRFQTDSDCRVMIAQMQVAGLGITLTAASTAVFYSLSYSYADYEQCCARIHRIGQHYPCNYIHLIAENTVDERILDIVKRKGSMAQLVVDDWKKLLKGED